MTQPLVTIKTLGAVELAADMTTWAGTLGPKAVSITRQYAALVKAAAIGLAASQMEVTDYKIQYVTTSGSRWIRGDVGTDDPAGYRHEFGFIGVDLSGRSYHDRPRPHFGPALDRYALAYEQAIAGLVVP